MGCGQRERSLINHLSGAHVLSLTGQSPPMFSMWNGLRVCSPLQSSSATVEPSLSQLLGRAPFSGTPEIRGTRASTVFPLHLTSVKVYYSSYFFGSAPQVFRLP